jgi:hypothetical protein
MDKRMATTRVEYSTGANGTQARTVRQRSIPAVDVEKAHMGAR